MHVDKYEKIGNVRLYNVKIEACLCNHLCSGKIINFIYSERG